MTSPGSAQRDIATLTLMDSGALCASHLHAGALPEACFSPEWIEVDIHPIHRLQSLLRHMVSPEVA